MNYNVPPFLTTFLLAVTSLPRAASVLSSPARALAAGSSASTAALFPFLRGRYHPGRVCPPYHLEFFQVLPSWQPPVTVIN